MTKQEILNYFRGINNAYNDCTRLDSLSCMIDELLEERGTEWEHLWDAPDGTFKGRCKKCGFVHLFAEGHDAQYKFCPECGKAVKWE